LYKNHVRDFIFFQTEQETEILSVAVENSQFLRC